MSDDWKDALAALRDAIPTDEGNTDVSSENGSVSAHSAGDAPGNVKTHTLEIVYERKGRGGHPATIVVCPQDMSDADVDGLAGTLRRRLGVGGSVRGGEILLQGDRRETLRALLPSLGFKAKG